MKHPIMILAFVILATSCNSGNWTSAPGNKIKTLFFDKVELKFDFGKKFDCSYIEGDYNEFKKFHKVNNEGIFSGEINTFTDILIYANAVEESRRPSITSKIYGQTSEGKDTTITKKFEIGDVTDKTLMNIDYCDYVATAMITIKSYKTPTYGLQVEWEVTHSGPNWDMKEFIKDGKVTGTAPAVVKCSTNNDSGIIAAREGVILDNTLSKNYRNDLELQKYILLEEQIFSPTLTNSIIYGAEDKVWSKPQLLQPLN